jgi:hypothetical protein
VKRIISVLTVAAIMAAMLVLTAAPALAQKNCGGGQTDAALEALFVEGNFGQFLKHLEKAQDCATGQSPGAGHDK